ncbi:MAG: hypothetical protein COY73_03060 [Candidatus Nealsonbacteria bacterium CG_4_10_14_0_8_um_filter_37_14]|uniref:Glycosyltransferase family 1 protein n=1 Tax=Candidatus Nealsonbacteria bacterium CG_4_10_14_0_8_um_filter_37_14 TaxID=1974684 RepID=A0A2M7R5M4_9BACT|nr:MAG: hypothetical protein COV63_00140 [Candidatus Nealsonbacteria bacterium CG11_big_fil_rev_8_21_14_0_20_37_68]PIY88715.1 MAG: hypothetical protein COY73_03060 [Candidatus Nealsonbacteria bacterium CG_4_10_14_0_8_um_filter_37_14]
MFNEKKNLKIGFFPLHSFARPGGVKEHVLALNKEFKKRGLQTKIMVPKSRSRERYGKDIKLFGTSFLVPIGGTQVDFTVCFRPGNIAKLLKKEKFDILHFQNFGFHSWQILRKSEAVNILTFHSGYNFKTNKFFKELPPSFNHFLVNWLQKTVNERIDGVIGVAPCCLDIFKDFPGPKTVIPNGIDIKEFNPQKPKIKKYCDGKINILFLGRIEEKKGLIYLLNAYKILKTKFKDLRLIIVGEGPLKEDCQNFANRNNLKTVHFEGVPPRKKNPSYYATADIFCAPAIFGESFGIVLLEAMASGKPVVAFANQGYRGVLEGKGKNFLANPRDWQGLAQKLEILIKSEAKRKEMADWGLKEAQKYSWEIIADRVLDFYNEVIKHKEKKL